MNKPIILILSLYLVSCISVDNEGSTNINQEIIRLSNYAEKNEYLEMIFDLDQNIRKNNDAELKPGSIAEQAHYHKMDSIDNLNFKRIDLYLKTYGYPKRDSVSSKALSSPWIVIHHSNLNDRLKHFNTLHQAYIKGGIDVMQFDLYLGRTYQMKYGKYPKWDGPYKPEDKVKWLINELGLE